MNITLADVIVQSIIDNTIRLVFDLAAFGVGYYFGRRGRPGQ